MQSELCVIDTIGSVLQAIWGPLYSHREKLGRGFTFPCDYEEVHRIARIACRSKGLLVSEEDLYLAANMTTSEAANMLFARYPDQK